MDKKDEITEVKTEKETKLENKKVMNFRDYENKMITSERDK